MSALAHCPSPPHWRLDWDALRGENEWVEALHGCPQDPAFHAEGDVGIHTRMACEALAASAEFRALCEPDRRAAFAAVLLHDVAKPACTRREGGRLTSRGHSARGDIEVRRMLWREGVEFELRETICGLVRYHQVPFFLIEKPDSQRLAFAVSQVARCDLLALVAWADGAGRRCADDADQRRILENVALFRDYCAENDCLVGPRRFASDHSRFVYFHKPGRDPDYRAHDDTRCEVIVMSGLPASGKDRWLSGNAAGLPVVSLDHIRDELGIDPAASQGRVIEAARERARALLRQGRSFAWNATNLSRSLRTQLIALLAGYNARIRVVYVEADERALRERNRARREPVPDRVIDRLLGRWQVPDLTEAHAVEVLVAEG